MKSTRRIDSVEVVASHDSELKEQAEGLLAKLAELHRRGPALRDGTTIDFGWSRLTLRTQDDKLVVHEPSFADDPFQRTVPDVSRTLHVLREQLALVTAVGVEPHVTRFDQKLTVLRGGLEQPRIYAERRATSNPEDSGWFIGDAGVAPPPSTGDNIDVLFVFQLVSRRRDVMQALGLPPGFLVVFDRETLEAVVDAGGATVWPRTPR